MAVRAPLHLLRRRVENEYHDAGPSGSPVFRAVHVLRHVGEEEDPES
jgi:hypothetical protein